jgi:hypothetical protein
MKTKLSLLLLSLVVLASCATKNPNAVQNSATGQWNQPPYNPADLSSISNTVKQVATAVSPANPYAGITNLLIEGGFGLAGIIAGGIAAYKNRNAVVTSMANAIAATGSHTAVLDHVSNSGDSTFAAVAGAINNALTSAQTFQSPAPPPKT